MKILVTGAKGFIGKNLCLTLRSLHLQPNHPLANTPIEVLECDIDTPPSTLNSQLDSCDFVFHLAGINRPKDPAEFTSGNTVFTEDILDKLAQRVEKLSCGVAALSNVETQPSQPSQPLNLNLQPQPIPVLLASSTQAALDNDYGRSKKEAEDAVFQYAERTHAPVFVYRFANVFGKWCRPNYNSAVATWCHNIAHNLPIQVRDPSAPITLIYIDDLVNALIGCLISRVEHVDRVEEGSGETSTDINSPCSTRSPWLNNNSRVEHVDHVENSASSLCSPRLIEEVRQIAYNLHVDLGNGMLEKVYENGLKHRLEKAGHKVEAQKPLKVYDKDGFLLGDYFVDLYVDDCLIIELKATKTIASEHLAQTINYLKILNQPQALLINFGSYQFECRTIHSSSTNSPRSSWLNNNGRVEHVDRAEEGSGETSPDINSPCSTRSPRLNLSCAAGIQNSTSSTCSPRLSESPDSTSSPRSPRPILSVSPSYTKTLGEITDLIYSFHHEPENLLVPNQSDEFTKKLYATYLSYLPEDHFSYPLTTHSDNRGSFTEILHTAERGQVSVNISKPGITKGQHWHHTKHEKFCVVSGRGLIQFRKMDNSIVNLNLQPQPTQPSQPLNPQPIIEYHVSGAKMEVIRIPPGYTHNIINLGDTDMVTLMWANEIFDPTHPDTYREEV